MCLLTMLKKLSAEMKIIIKGLVIYKKKIKKTLAYCSSFCPALLCRLVTITPGFTEFTRTPLSASSTI